MAKKRIFISCGQITQDEKRFGQELGELLDKHDMVGFFAEEAHEPTDLYSYLFRELQRCDGYIAVLQDRGQVRYENFDAIHRASVWIQQEISVVFYRCFLLGRPIPMRIYMERGLRREGFVTVSIINPIQFDNKDTVFEDLDQWLKGPTFEEQPVLLRREDVFEKRARTLDQEDWLLLELIAVHSPDPGGLAPEAQITMDFKNMCPQAKTKQYYTRTKLGKLESTGLVTITQEHAVRRIQINKPWWDLILEELRNQGRKP